MKKEYSTPQTNFLGTLNLNRYKIDSGLEKNIALMNMIFKDDNTLIVRPFENRQNGKIKCCAFFLNGMIDNKIVNQYIIKPIINSPGLQDSENLLTEMVHVALYSDEVQESTKMDDIVQAILYGDTAVFAEGCTSALIINSKGWKTRSIDEPDSEKALHGPHEGFTESIMTNITLIRRRIITSDLKCTFRTFGTRSNTKACLCYLDSLVDKKILHELCNRLDKIVIDGVLDTNYLSEYIRDARYSPFKTVGLTERPDSVAGKILEGRIAILLDGTPSVLTVPYLFIENFQSSEDYYLSYYFSSFGRILRIIGFLLSTSIPAIYLSLVTFHFEMIPTKLAVSIAQARQGIPFPTIVECLLMLFVFELIRETGLRLPSSIGQSLSIVGALVIGQAAVQAKFVSAPIVIVIATTAITGLINTKLSGVTIIIRVIFLFASAMYGLYGYFFACIGVLIHILSLRSFEIPYTSHLASYALQHNKDNIFRAPWWIMKTRPSFLAQDKVRSIGKQ